MICCTILLMACLILVCRFINQPKIVKEFINKISNKNK
jgi:hypothetical protein